MIIKERETYLCPNCKKPMSWTLPIYGCDVCGKPIDANSVLTVKAFWQERITISSGEIPKSDHYHFCEWYCLLKKLPQLKSDNFIALPMLLCDGDSDSENSTVANLLDAMKRINEESA